MAHINGRIGNQMIDCATRQMVPHSRMFVIYVTVGTPRDPRMASKQPPTIFAGMTEWLEKRRVAVPAALHTSRRHAALSGRPGSAADLAKEVLAMLPELKERERRAVVADGFEPGAFRAGVR